MCTTVGFAGIEGLKPGEDTVILVTGAATWVGGHVAKALIDAGYTVQGLKFGGGVQGLQGYLAHKKTPTP